MMEVVTYRMQVLDAVGHVRKTVDRDSSFNLGSRGMRMSLTPEMGCDEMTMVSRNGPVAGGGNGLGLNPLDIVTFEVSSDGSTFFPIWCGELRQGGNLYDYLGESMVLRGLDVRLRETSTPEKSYAQMDGGALARTLLLDTLRDGALGREYTLNTLSLQFDQPEPIIRYDPLLLPDLGFQMTLKATNRQPLGVLLDGIVTAAASVGLTVRWGVRPDRYLYMTVARTDELTWPAEGITWKEPTAQVIYTSVLWDIEKRQDTGRIFRYESRGPDVARYGTRQRAAQLYPGLNVWSALPTVPSYSVPPVYSPATDGSDLYVRDGDNQTRAILTSTTAPVSVSITIPAGGAERLFIDAASEGLPAFARIDYPNGQSFLIRASDPSGKGFTSYPYYADYFSSTVVALGLPEGAVVTLIAPESTTGAGATLNIWEFRVEVLNRSALDAAATALYSVPLAAPGDLRKQGVLLPRDFAGTVRTARPTGADYTAPVSRFEYLFTNAGGAQTFVKTGEPDDPAAVARNTLIRRLANQATSNAVQASSVL